MSRNPALNFHRFQKKNHPVYCVFSTVPWGGGGGGGGAQSMGVFTTVGDIMSTVGVILSTVGTS